MSNDDDQNKIFWIARHPEEGVMICTLANDRDTCFGLLEDQVLSAGLAQKDFQICPVKLVLLKGK